MSLKYDDNSIQGSLWKMKKGLTGYSWKKKWMISDKDYLYQWHGKEAPKNNELPKHIFELTNCEIVESKVRDYAFKITERYKNISTIYAADSESDYRSWMSFICPSLIEESDDSKESYRSTDDYEEKSNETDEEIDYYDDDELASNILDDMESLNLNDTFYHMKEDIIRDLFFHFNIYKNSSLPCIKSSNFKYILKFLDPFLNVKVVSKLICSDLNITRGSNDEFLITLTEFELWWSANKLYLRQYKSKKNGQDNTLRNTIQEFSLAQSYLDSLNLAMLGFSEVPAMTDPYRSNILFHTPIPSFSTNELIKIAAPINEIEDWNKLYQNLYDSIFFESVLILKSKFDNHHILKMFTGKSPEDSTIADLPNATNETGSQSIKSKPHIDILKELKTQEKKHDYSQSQAEILRMSVSLATVYGQFSKVALDGVRIIIDEFSLPDDLKTIKKINMIDSSDKDSISDSLTYRFGGLLFRMVDSPFNHNFFNDQETSESDQAYYLSSIADEKLRKSAGNESKYQLEFQKNHESYFSIPSKSSFANEKSKLASPLTITLDYAGFRFVVSAPIDIRNHIKRDDIATGSELKSLETESNEDKLHQEDGSHLNQSDSNEHQLEMYKDILQNLNTGWYLNQKLKARLQKLHSNIPVYYQNKDELSDSSLDISGVNLFNGVDGRTYLFCLPDLYPPDFTFPTTQSSEIFRLRPEFLSSLNEFIDSGKFEYYHKIHGNKILIDLSSLNSPSEMTVQIVALNLAYRLKIFYVADLLNSLQDIPFDSHSLTKFLHSHGISCRHIGLLIHACKIPFIKQLLFSEAVARCSKTLQNFMLRDLARESEYESFKAKYRGRSSETDFIEYMEFSNGKRKDLVLELFNNILGYGPNAIKYWEGKEFLFERMCSHYPSVDSYDFLIIILGPLKDLLYRKFRIDLEEQMFYSSLYRPQLFLSMQFHMGVRFQDKEYSILLDQNSHLYGGSLNIKPFTLNDLVEYLIPKMKPCFILPGYIGNFLNLSDLYIRNQLLSEGLAVLSLRRFLHSVLYPNDTLSSFGPLSEQSWIVYKQALAKYFQGDIQSSFTLLNSYLDTSLKYQAFTSRAITLLMTMAFEKKRESRSLLYYDAAFSVLQYTSGKTSPFISFLMLELSKLYLMGGQTKKSSLFYEMAFEYILRCLNSPSHNLIRQYSLLKAQQSFKEKNYELSAEIFNDILIENSSIQESNERENIHGTASSEDLNLNYHLMVINSNIGELDSAIYFGFKCHEFFSVEINFQRYPKLAISSLLLLGDLFTTKGENDSAVEMWQETWGSLKKLYGNHINWAADLMNRLSIHIIKFMFAKLPLSTRNLIETVAQNELETIQQQNNYSLWREAANHVANYLWIVRPAEYFALLIKGLEEQELSEQDQSSDISRALASSLAHESNAENSESDISFSLQVAVLYFFIN